jgi:hydroxyacylglutathione hydrolase
MPANDFKPGEGGRGLKWSLMIHEMLAVGPLQCNCSILGDESSREAIVVDPGDDIPRILALLARHGLTLKQILVTHAHVDHIAGAHRLKQLTGAPILYNQNDLPLVQRMDLQAAWLGIPTPEVAPPDDHLQDNRIIAIGAGSADPSSVSPGPEQGRRGLTGSILHTPGHTEGSVCLYLPDQSLLLAGDTLFAGSVGRTDLPGGNTRKLLRSIHDRLLPLPDDTRVIPGHGAPTTIAAERASNPFLQNL